MTELPRLADLRTVLARVHAERRPLLIFFSTPGCPFCIEVRRNYLLPRLADKPPSALIYEVDITSARRFVGRAGAQQSEQAFAAAQGVKMVPYVLLVDAELKPLTPPLIGLDASGFYEGYLQGAIDTARAALR